MDDGLSSRGRVMLAPATSYLGAHYKALSDPWAPGRGDGGCVTLAVAENKLSFDMLQARLPDLRKQPARVCGYDNMRGTDSFRAALARFLSARVFKRSVDPTQLCVGVGVGALLNHLALALFEQGDGVLVPAPSYASFDFDLKVVAGVRTLAVYSQPPEYRLTYDVLEAAANAYEAKGIRVRGIILTNPQNPLGVVYAPDELRSVLRWALERRAHVLADEIYALSVFGDVEVGEASPSERGGFVSVAEVAEEEDWGQRLHLLWGFSKDFGVSGFRVGALWTRSTELLSALDSVSYFSAVPNPLQEALAEVINDERWVGDYLAENARRLRAACALCVTALDRLRIPHTPAVAGMYLWVDMREFLRGEGWAAEVALCEAMNERGLVLTPGESNHANEPGYFRLCYAFNAVEVLGEGLRRLEVFVVDCRKGGLGAKS